VLLCSHLAFAVAPLFAPRYFPEVAPHDLVTGRGRAEWLFDRLVWPPFFVSGVVTWAIVMPGFAGSFWFLRRLSTLRVAVWGVMAGIWAAMLFFRSPLVVTASVLGSALRAHGRAGVIAVDTNVLVYVHREELPQHAVALARLTALAEGDAPWGIHVASRPTRATWRPVHRRARHAGTSGIPAASSSAA
jgi:hypothetical protein